MSSNTWGVALLLLGCGSKLEVDRLPPGHAGAGAGGTGASDVVLTGGTAGSDVVVTGGSAGIVEGGGYGGTLTDPIPAGTLGQPCIPGSTVIDAMGTFAQASVVQLDHCADGLNCGSDGVCGASPDCSQSSGVCLVRRADPSAGGSGNSGGSDGASGSRSIAGGPGVDMARPEPTVVALAADDSHLYWVEYGTRDSLGNHKNDGALLSFAFADGVTKKLAAALPGPVGVGVTSSHVYVYVDGAPLIGSPIRSQLLRLPLAGGTPELVQDGAIPGAFIGVGDRAFWSNEGVYETASDAGAVPSVFYAAPTAYVSTLVADTTNLYVRDQAQGVYAIERVPLVGGAAEVLGLNALSFALKDDFLYGVEEINNGTGLILDRAAKSGGSWQRIRALGSGGVATLRIAGDRYFWSSHPPQVGAFEQPDYSRMDIQTASFASDDPPLRLLRRSVQQYFDPFQWVGTATAFYWTDGRAIYSLAL